jgi:spore coat protein U-like protein
MSESRHRGLVFLGCSFAWLLLIAPENAYAMNCKITASQMTFGTYMPLTPTHVDVMGQFSIRCQAQPGTFVVTIGPGMSGTQLARILSAGGGNSLNYNLYLDPARTQIWGDGTPPSFTVTGVRPNSGRPNFYNYPIYGRIFANQAPNPGLYADNLIATVLF